MDFNAQFSELFEKNVFSPIEDLLVTEYKSLFYFCCHSGYYFSCDQQISLNNEVLVNDITLGEILHRGTLLDQWSDFIAQNSILTRIHCPHRATVFRAQTVVCNLFYTVSDSSTRYYCKNPKENSCIKKMKKFKKVPVVT